MSEATPEDPAPTEEKLPPMGHVACGWPLVLVFIGGAIGGGLGGAAYAINAAIYRSSMPLPVKVLLNLVTGVSAGVLWFVIALAIHAARS